jgi:uncharacterized membrane-anchored protein
VRSRVAFLVAVLVQVALMAAVPATKVWVRSTGRPVLLTLRPADPYDPFRGYHLVLAYDIGDASRFENADLANGRRTLWTILAIDDEGIGRPVRFANERPASLAANEIVLRGKARGGRITYGIETFYIPEKGRGDLETRFREGLADARAEVRVGGTRDAALVALHLGDEVIR